MRDTLHALVNAVAADLMAANAANSAQVSERVLAEVNGHFQVDFSFLRHNDHDIRATVLVAEWPPRNLDPDPIGVIYFDEADSIFAQAEHLKEPGIVQPRPDNADYQQNIEDATGYPPVTLACVPLLSDGVTTGLLGFGKLGDREWLQDELNALTTIATLFAQLQARLVAEEHVHYLASHDELTGLTNRRTLLAHLDERLCEGSPGPVSILFLDLDRLRIINDHLGEALGDRFIQGIAEALREGVDVPAEIARLAGDEFVVVPAATMEIDAAEALAKRLQTHLHKFVEIDGERIARTVSIGVAAGEPGRVDSSELLSLAEQATRSVKRSGGGQVGVFSARMAEQEDIRNDIELHLHDTFEHDSGKLLLHYLPEFDLRTGEVLGAEALIRWQHPTRGLLLPDSFIDIIESGNLSSKLGRFILRKACAQFSSWQQRGLGRGAVLNVNVSPALLLTHGIVDTVADTLGEFGIDPGAVCLEITERVVIDDLEAARAALTGLKEVGVQIAVDDFGTGYSALGYLKHLPVDALKIDRGFVGDLGINTRDGAIVESIMTFAKAFHLEVVAEGVETADAARALIGLGCFRAQGFLLSRPLATADMEALLTRGAIPIDFLTGPRDPLTQ